MTCFENQAYNDNAAHSNDNFLLHILDPAYKHTGHRLPSRILRSRYQDGTSSNPFFMFLAMQLPHTPFDGDNVEESFRKLYANGSAFLDEKYNDLTTYDEDSESAKTSHIGVRKLIICRFKIFTPTSINLQNTF